MVELDLSGLRDGAPLRAYVARPSGAGPWPGVVMVHEILGLDDVMRGHADRLGALGYLTIVPDLFSAGGARRCLVAVMRALQTGRGSAFADLRAARAWLQGSPDCTDKIGVIGFCMGGGFALLTANTGYQVASPNYGYLPKNLARALEGTCPIVASYGAKDRTIRGAAAELENVLTALGVEHDVKQYPYAGHSFLNPVEIGPRPLRPLLRVLGIKPDPTAASDAWQRIDDYFAAYLSQTDQ